MVGRALAAGGCQPVSPVVGFVSRVRAVHPVADVCYGTQRKTERIEGKTRRESLVTRAIYTDSRGYERYERPPRARGSIWSVPD